MRCPACERELQELAVDEMWVDVCEGGCGGLWFDHKELAQLGQAHGADTAKLLQVSRDPAVEVDMERKRACPRCKDAMPMQRHLFSPASKVAVDECPACGGVWLDVGELGAFADQLDPTGEKRREAERDFLAQVDKELERARTREPAAQPHTLSTVASIFDISSA